MWAGRNNRYLGKVLLDESVTTREHHGDIGVYLHEIIHKYSPSRGLEFTPKGLVINLGITIGALVDAFGDYKYMYYVCGAVMLLAGIFLFIMNYYNYRLLEKEEKEREKEEEEEKVELEIPGSEACCESEETNEKPTTAEQEEA
ncbi:MOT1 protein, partial [Polypterus senegalus]